MTNGKKPSDDDMFLRSKMSATNKMTKKRETHGRFVDFPILDEEITINDRQQINFIADAAPRHSFGLGSSEYVSIFVPHAK